MKRWGIILLVLFSPLMTEIGRSIYAYIGVSIFNRVDGFLWYCDQFPGSELTDSIRSSAANMIWEPVKREDTRTAYQSYVDTVRRLPCSVDWYLFDAYKRLDEIDWQEAQTLDTLDAYTAYLAAHPNGEFVPEARQVVDDEPDWQAAVAINQFWGYSDYLQAHPNGSHGDEARQWQEDHLWNNAITYDNPYGYDAYIREFPQGTHALEAARRLEALSWIEAIARDDWMGYQNYIQYNRNGQHILEARQRQSELPPPVYDSDYSYSGESRSCGYFGQYINGFSHPPSPCTP